MKEKDDRLKSLFQGSMIPFDSSPFRENLMQKISVRTKQKERRNEILFCFSIAGIILALIVGTSFILNYLKIDLWKYFSIRNIFSSISGSFSEIHAGPMLFIFLPVFLLAVLDYIIRYVYVNLNKFGKNSGAKLS